MKNVEIAEGGIGRRLSGTKFVLTDKPESDQMEVWVDEDDRKLARLYATNNGTYYPEQYDAYGFSSVTVSIHGGVANPDLPNIEMPDGTIAPVLIPEIEMPDGTTLPIDELFPDIPLDDVKVPDTVGDEGSSIMGIDPEDGYTYKVDVDENGNLDIEKVPTGVEITKPPKKTEYEFGDDIDYDGMEVSLVDKDGNIVKTKEYPDGKIPLDDESLNLPTENIPEIKDRSDVKGTWTAKSGLSIPDLVCVSQFWYYKEWSGTTSRFSQRYTRTGIMVVQEAWLGHLHAYYVSSTREGVGYGYTSVITNLKTKETTSKGGFEGLSVRSFTYAGKTAYFEGLGSGFGTVESQSITGVNIRMSGFEGAAAWTALYGDMTANQELEAEWTSPYSGVVYKDGTTVVTSEPKKDE